jgi:hypothetical protein
VQIESRFPPLLADAERAAGAGQSSYLRWSALSLILACVAAVGGALTWKVQIGSQTVDLAGAAAALAFAAGVGVVLYLLNLRPQRDWYEGRAAAESVKTLAWQYAVGGGQHRVDAPGDADALFLDRLVEIMDQMNTVEAGAPGSSEQITAAMRALRARPLAQRREAYLEQRVDDQIGWYTAKAQHNRRQVRRWSAIAIVAQVIGLAAAGLKAFDVVEIDVLGIVAAVAASATAWMQTKDHQNLAESYRVTAKDLGIIRTRAGAPPPPATEQEWAEFVEEAERAISREHTLWLARRGSA